MQLFVEMIDSQVPDMHERGARVRFVGRREGAPDELVRRIEEAEALTAGNTRMTLYIAFSYGGRRELLDAAQGLAAEYAASAFEGDVVAPGGAPEFSDDDLRRHLYAPEMHDPELLIRTSGELRISNFLLWQCAYSELYFSDRYWPDFGPEELDAALADYAGRQRRFGGRRAAAPAGADAPAATPAGEAAPRDDAHHHRRRPRRHRRRRRAAWRPHLLLPDAGARPARAERVLPPHDEVPPAAAGRVPGRGAHDQHGLVLQPVRRVRRRVRRRPLHRSARPAVGPQARCDGAYGRHVARHALPRPRVQRRPAHAAARGRRRRPAHGRVRHLGRRHHGVLHRPVLRQHADGAGALPKKTWEGFAGGAISTVLLVVFIGLYTPLGAPTRSSSAP